MGIEKHNFIMKYDTPLGTYAVDESFDIWLDGKMIDSEGRTIVDVRRKIAVILDQRRGQEILNMQTRIGELNGMSQNIEDYRVKF